MSPPTLDRAAAKLLSAEPVGDLTPSPKARSASIDALRGALVKRAKARARRRWALPLAGVFVAASVALAVGAQRPQAPTPPAVVGVATHVEPLPVKHPFAIAHPMGESAFILSTGRRAPITEGKELEPKDVVGTADNPMTVDLESSKLDVEATTEVVLPANGEEKIVELRRGALVSRVSKLGPSQRFVVRTEDAEVEVRGTVFRVAYASNGASCGGTEVNVTEGRVVVRARDGEHVLVAGETWKQPCAPRAAPPPAIAPHVPDHRPRPEPPEPPTSALARQNTLYADAMRAKRRGDAGDAVGSLDELIERYPSSPLREAAEAERMKLLAGIDAARAVTAARTYVVRYPNGFAVADADAILKR